MADIEIADEKIDFAKEARVEVLNTKTNREAKFDVPWTATLQTVWNESYTKFHPPEHKDAADKFQCQQGGVDLTPHLALTLRQAHEQHICVARKYQIVGGTGGA